MTPLFDRSAVSHLALTLLFLPFAVLADGYGSGALLLRLDSGDKPGLTVFTDNFTSPAAVTGIPSAYGPPSQVTTQQLTSTESQTSTIDSLLSSSGTPTSIVTKPLSIELLPAYYESTASSLDVPTPFVPLRSTQVAATSSNLQPAASNTPTASSHSSGRLYVPSLIQVGIEESSASSLDVPSPFFFGSTANPQTLPTTTNTPTSSSSISSSPSIAMSAHTENTATTLDVPTTYYIASSARLESTVSSLDVPTSYPPSQPDSTQSFSLPTVVLSRHTEMTASFLTVPTSPFSVPSTIYASPMIEVTQSSLFIPPYPTPHNPTPGGPSTAAPEPYIEVSQTSLDVPQGTKTPLTGPTAPGTTSTSTTPPSDSLIANVFTAHLESGQQSLQIPTAPFQVPQSNALPASGPPPTPAPASTPAAGKVHPGLDGDVLPGIESSPPPGKAVSTGYVVAAASPNSPSISSSISSSTSPAASSQLDTTMSTQLTTEPNGPSQSLASSASPAGSTGGAARPSGPMRWEYALAAAGLGLGVFV